MRRTIVLRGRRLSYELEKKNIRGVNLHVRPDGSIYVSAPWFMTEAELEDLLRKKQDWLLRHLAAPRAPAPDLPERVCLAGEALTPVLRAGARRCVERDGERLILTVKDPEDPEEALGLLDAWQRQLCTERVTALCREVYPAFEERGVPFPKFSFRRMKSRWGSCRPQGVALSFNTRLVEVPPDCALYVVVHEFAHFLQPNHSEAFYAEVARVLPDWKERRSRLRAWEKSHPLT